MTSRPSTFEAYWALEISTLEKLIAEERDDAKRERHLDRLLHVQEIRQNYIDSLVLHAQNAASSSSAASGSCPPPANIYRHAKSELPNPNPISALTRVLTGLDLAVRDISMRLIPISDARLAVSRCVLSMAGVTKVQKFVKRKLSSEPGSFDRIRAQLLEWADGTTTVPLQSIKIANACRKVKDWLKAAPDEELMPEDNSDSDTSDASDGAAMLSLTYQQGDTSKRDGAGWQSAQKCLAKDVRFVPLGPVWLKNSADDTVGGQHIDSTFSGLRTRPELRVLQEIGKRFFLGAKQPDIIPKNIDGTCGTGSLPCCFAMPVMAPSRNTDLHPFALTRPCRCDMCPCLPQCAS